MSLRLTRATPLAARFAGLATLVAFGATAGDARAQGSNEANRSAAVAAFGKGVDAEGAGNWAEALDEFVTAQALAHETAQIDFHMGHCEAKLGRLVDAKGHLERAIDLAKNAGADKVGDTARQELDDVVPRIPTLTLGAPANATATKITIDGKPLATSVFGLPIPLNATAHEIVVELGDKPTFRRTLTLAERAHETLVVEVPAATTASTTPTVAPAPAPAAAPERPATSGGGKSQVLPIALLAGGGAAIVGGIVFWVMRSSELSDLDQLCPNGRDKCPASSTSAVNDGTSKGELYTGLSVTLFAVGAVAAGTGGGMLLFGGKSSGSASARVVPAAGPHGGGLRLVGSF